MKTIAASKTTKLAVILKASATHPITGGRIAPPTMAIIIKPEISLARVG